MTVSSLSTDDSGDKVYLTAAQCLLFIFLTEDFDQIIDRALKTGVEKVNHTFFTLQQVEWI